MIRASKAAVLACWILTLACCAATLFLGYGVIFAIAFGGLFDLLAPTGSRTSKVGNSELLLALLPSALAAGGNVWMLWGRRPRDSGVSPWWLVPALAVAVATFAFGAWVCVDVWDTRS